MAQWNLSEILYNRRITSLEKSGFVVEQNPDHVPTHFITCGAFDDNALGFVYEQKRRSLRGELESKPEQTTCRKKVAFKLVQVAVHTN